MIITRSPYRVSFFGGGTDYPSWYSVNGGQCLSATLDKYCYISLRKMPPFTGFKYLFLYSKFEKVNSVDDIQHPGIKGCLKYLDMDEGMEANHAGDLPARSGLGSSSAFTVSMLHALRTLRGDHFNKQQLSFDAINVEQRVLGETVGIQDQIACAYGGINFIEINRDGSYRVNRILDEENSRGLEDHLVLVYTGIQRYASDIAKTQIDNIKRKEKELHKISEMVPLASKALIDKDYNTFGEMLHESWMMKRELSEKISNKYIDKIYEIGKKNGALGGKVLGAGGGGFMVFMVTPEKRRVFLNAMENICIPVRFSHNGTELILK